MLGPSVPEAIRSIVKKNVVKEFASIGTEIVIWENEICKESSGPSSQEPGVINIL